VKTIYYIFHQGFVTKWRTIHCSLMINLVRLFAIPNTFVSSFNSSKDECWKLIYIMDLHLHLLPLLRGLPCALIAKEHCLYIQKLFCLPLHILGANLLLVHLIWKDQQWRYSNRVYIVCWVSFIFEFNCFSCLCYFSSTNLL
jgi:hypothetical protein